MKLVEVVELESDFFDFQVGVPEIYARSLNFQIGEIFHRSQSGFYSEKRIDSRDGIAAEIGNIFERDFFL